MGQPLRVLIVEDSPDDADLVVLQLRQGGYEPDWERVDTAAAMSAALGRRGWDAVICDYRMPGFSGPQALGLLKELGLDLPFIIVSGTIGEDLAVEVMKAGAGDYLLKGHLARLCPVVERELKDAQVRRGRRKTERRQELAISILRILNHADEAQKLISGLAHLLKEHGGFDAVGVRLREGAGYPYIFKNGFPPSFMKEAVCGAAGQPILECFCGAVISGRADPSLPCFTKGGSFWTNSMSKLFAAAAPLGAGQALRRDCLEAGFESMTLLPLRSSTEIIGILQLAAGRQGRFDPEDIAFLEDMAVSIGIALRRQRAEDALKRSESRYRRLFETAKDGILILDAETAQIVDVNRFMVDLLGYSHEEYLGKKLWDIGPFKDDEACRAAFHELQARGDIRYENLPVQAKDGRKFDVEFVSNVYSIDGKKVIQCNVRDITQRKRAEAEKGKLEEQLRQSQKMEAVGRLAGGVAHDFNNLLTAISGYSEFLLAALPADDPNRADVEEIRKAGERAATLTRQLLAFSRKQVLQPRVLNLDAAIPDMSKLIRRVIGEDIEFQTRLGSAPANVKADPGQIEQVIMNLVVNARDAMPDGGKLVLETAAVELGEDYAQSHPDTVPGRYVMLAVSDTGQGMSPDVMTRIFEPFFTTKERGKGTGLGLSTVYGIVEQSGGSIFVYSEPGQGTSFKLYFPRVDAPAVEESASRPPLSSCRGTEMVLVVEDDEAVRKLVLRTLSENGYAALAAPSPPEAIRLCERQGADIQLLITDVVMPQMNGRELAKRLEPLCPGMKVIFMSGYTDDVIVHRGVLEPGVVLMEKPLTPEAILRKVRETLDA